MKPLPDWRNRTVACLASGPSLTVEDCVRARDSGWATVVTNTTYQLCPWADALFAHDSQWWKAHIAGVRRCFAGRLFSPSLHVLYRGVESLAVNMQWRNFHNSGANAISLAMVCGASRIVLLGFDCALTGGRSHHHGDHPGALRNCDTIDKWPAQFAKVAAYADKRRILVFNASRVSALTCFPRVTLEQVQA